MVRTPQLDATLNAINGKLAAVDEGMKQTGRLSELTRRPRCANGPACLPGTSCEKLEARMMPAPAHDGGGRQAGGAARSRAELDTLKSQCEAVLARTLDAQQKIEAVGHGSRS